MYYIHVLGYSSVPTAINSLMNPILFQPAQDLTATLASQTYYKQIPSIYGEQMSAGRRNWLTKTLYTRRFLKANKQHFK